MSSTEPRNRVVRVDGTVDPIDGAPRIKKIESMIGAACIDTVNLRDGRVMLVDDNGIEKNLPINPIATGLYHSVCRAGTIHQIRGDVAVVFDNDFA